MKMRIKTITAFQCPMCMKIHKLAPHASRCLKRCKLVEEQEEAHRLKEASKLMVRNSVRFEASSLDHAIQLLQVRAKEAYDISLEISQYPKEFGIQSITHAAPVGKETNRGSGEGKPQGHLGWSGQWKGSIRGKIKDSWGEKKEVTFSDFIGTWSRNTGFAGFHIGTGSGGSDFDISGEIFVEDFPQIWNQTVDRYTGKKLCCNVSPWKTCKFCSHRWCSECGKDVARTKSIYYREPVCPFDGHPPNMKLWLDDIRDPVRFRPGEDWHWCKTNTEFIRMLATVSPDHIEGFAVDHDKSHLCYVDPEKLTVHTLLDTNRIAQEYTCDETYEASVRYLALWAIVNDKWNVPLEIITSNTTKIEPYKNILGNDSFQELRRFVITVNVGGCQRKEKK